MATNNMSLQVGQSKMPAQIVWGAHARDAGKKNNSVKVLVSALDSETLQLISKMEAEVARNNQGLELNSCVGPAVTNPSNPDESGHVLRLKLTKNYKCYLAQDAWETGAAPTLDTLDYGHLCLFKCRAVTWTYKNACGITLYANLVNGVGMAPQPWGREEQPQKDAVQWS